MNYLNLVRKIAWSFHRTTGVDWRELFSEGCEAYYRVLHSHDFDKSKEMTWVYNCVTNQIINFLKEEDKYKNKEIREVDFDWLHPVIDTPDYFPEECDLSFDDYDLSKDVKVILRMVFKNIPRYSKKAALSQIRKDLREIREWSHPRINTSMKALRNELKLNIV